MHQLPYCSSSSIASLPLSMLNQAISGMRRMPMPFLLAAMVFAGATLPAQTPLRITRGVDATQTRALLDQHPSWANHGNSVRVLPDDQRLFFEVMAQCRDAWDCAFCCWHCPCFGARNSRIDKL